jgi:hypothetical protein
MSIGIGRQVNLIGFSCWAIALLVEIKAQFNAPSPGSGVSYAQNHHQKYVRRCCGPYAHCHRFLPCGDNSHNAPARKRVESSHRIFIKGYGCSVRLQRVGD